MVTETTTKYRVWYQVIGGDSHVHPVSSPEEGARWINDEAQCQLANPNIIANVFGMDMLEDGEWTDWEGEIDGTYYANADELCDALAEED